MTKREINELMERAAEWPEDAKDELVRSMEDIEARVAELERATEADKGGRH